MCFSSSLSHCCSCHLQKLSEQNCLVCPSLQRTASASLGCLAETRAVELWLAAHGTEGTWKHMGNDSNKGERLDAAGCSGSKLAERLGRHTREQFLRHSYQDKEVVNSTCLPTCTYLVARWQAKINSTLSNGRAINFSNECNANVGTCRRGDLPCSGETRSQSVSTRFIYFQVFVFDAKCRSK